MCHPRRGAQRCRLLNLLRREVACRPPGEPGPAWLRRVLRLHPRTLHRPVDPQQLHPAAGRQETGNPVQAGRVLRHRCLLRLRTGIHPPGTETKEALLPLPGTLFPALSPAGSGRHARLLPRDLPPWLGRAPQGTIRAPGEIGPGDPQLEIYKTIRRTCRSRRHRQWLPRQTEPTLGITAGRAP